MLLLLPSLEMLLIKHMYFLQIAFHFNELTYLWEWALLDSSTIKVKVMVLQFLLLNRATVKTDSAEHGKQLGGKARIGIWGTCFFQEDVRRLLLEETVQWVLLTNTAAYWRPSLSSDRGHKQGETTATATSARLIFHLFFPCFSKELLIFFSATEAEINDHLFFYPVRAL